MNILRRLQAVLVAALFIVCFTGMAIGYQGMPIADVEVGSNGIFFQPRISYGQASLTVSCPDGRVFYKLFPQGATPYLGLSDGDWNTGDGSYTYELKLSPRIEKKARKDEKTTNFLQKPMVLSGYFTVRGGGIVPTGRPESGPAASVQVTHSEDTYVVGSLCVGTDCADPETWAYDVIRLKENNLRIHFDDTSATSSFPNNDWRIIVNDTADGGANYFAVEDSTAADKIFVIEAGAPANSLYVEDYGRIGLKTSTPGVELHIVDGDSPAVRFEQDTSSGWTAQVWDIAANESNFFVRDVTNSSKLPFRIQPGAPSSSLCIKSDGKIGVGTWSPGFPFEIELTGSDAVLVADRTDGATAQMAARADKTMFGSRTNHSLNLSVNNSPRVTVSTGGFLGIADTTPSYPIEVGNANGAYLNTSGNWVNPSSRALKENIENITAAEALDALNGLTPVKYNFKVDKTEQYLGFIAEDVPPLVSINDKKGMVTMDVVAVLTRVVQEQQETITELKKEIAELRENAGKK